MMTYKTAPPRIGTVAPGTKKPGLIDKAMRAPAKVPAIKPVQPMKARY